MTKAVLLSIKLPMVVEFSCSRVRYGQSVLTHQKSRMVRYPAG